MENSMKNHQDNSFPVESELKENLRSKIIFFGVALLTAIATLLVTILGWFLLKDNNLPGSPELFWLGIFTSGFLVALAFEKTRYKKLAIWAMVIFLFLIAVVAIILTFFK